MIKLIENEILNNYGKVVVLANVEENEDDVNLIIKYSDHGDEFIFVRTKNGEMYEYGYYLNRSGFPDIERLENSWAKDYFIRNPIMYFKTDVMSGLSNSIHFRIRDSINKDRDCFKYRKEYSADYAQLKFNDILEYIEQQKNKGIRFDCENYKSDLKCYLDVNGIMTAENMDKLSKMSFNTRVNGVDGIAAKRKIENYNGFRLSGDDILRIIINGKEKDPSKISKKVFYDDYGVEGFSLSLGQFR